MLASLARTLHMGVLADCFFDPGTALCEAGDKCRYQNAVNRILSADEAS
jgi:hypothetical protein